MNNKTPKISFFLNLILLTLMSFFVFSFVFTNFAGLANDTDIQKVTYQEFKSILDNGDVKAITYSEGAKYMKFFAPFDILDKTSETNEEESNDVIKENNYLSITSNKDVRITTKDRTILKELNEENNNQYTIFYTTYPNYEEFEKDALEFGADVYIESPASKNLVSILSIIEFVLMASFLLLMISAFTGTSKDKKGGLGSIFNVGHTEIKKETSNKKFSDVIGHEEIMEDIQFIAKLIKNPKKCEEIGIKVPKGLLLTGPPGTGKTLIAKAIAGEADVPFYYFPASKFIEVFVGVGASRVRELFKEAKKNAPCIIFIDELDAIGKKRSSTTGNNESDQTLLQLLNEMDGFNPRDGVFVIAATNKPKSLDSGLVRAGRFDRQIEVGPPRDWRVRKQLFDHYLKALKVGDDISTELLARQSSTFTGADIEAVCNEAGIVALMHNKEYIDYDCIEEAMDKKIFHGNRSKKKAIEDDRKYVAYHEAGHAIMSLLTGNPITRASIIGTTSGVGGAVFHSDKDSSFRTVKELQDSVMIAYAGRASEEIKFTIPTTGASNDIEQATATLDAYIEVYGFDEKFGLINMNVIREIAPAVDGNITEEISTLSRDLYKKTKELLQANYDKVEILAQALLVEETIAGPDIEKLVGISTSADDNNDTDKTNNDEEIVDM